MNYCQKCVNLIECVWDAMYVFIERFKVNEKTLIIYFVWNFSTFEIEFVSIILNWGREWVLICFL